MSKDSKKLLLDGVRHIDLFWKDKNDQDMDSDFYKLDKCGQHNKDKLFNIEGTFAKGGEINYFLMGMAMRSAGLSLHDAYFRVFLWKEFRYNAKPTGRTLWFLEKGYNEYYDVIDMWN